MNTQQVTDNQATIDLFEDQTKLRSLEEFRAYCKQVLPQRLAFEKRLTPQGQHEGQWRMGGYCQACEKMVLLVADWQYSDNITPNYRERLVCPECQLNNRQRFAMGLLKQMLAKMTSQPPVIYLYEQVTSFYHYVNTHLAQAKIIGSEYCGFEYKSGEMTNGIRHEDAMAMSLETESIDLIISNDVYEHVPNYQLALQEAYRVLRAGGKLVFSIPFYPNSKEIEFRAKFENGQIIHLKEEQYHGNPMLDKGSLVFNEFGWGILDSCNQAGFSDAYALYYYSIYYGNIGAGAQQIFIAEK